MLIWIALIFLLVCVAWQDFMYREVHIGLFLSIASLAVVQAFIKGVFAFETLMLNWGIVFVHLMVLNGVICWWTKTRKWLMVGEQWLGWGDIVFFAIIGCFFSTFNFICFYVISLLITLLMVMLLVTSGRTVRSIPLAGAQALLLACLLALNPGSEGSSLYEDIHMDWLSAATGF